MPAPKGQLSKLQAPPADADESTQASYDLVALLRRMFSARGVTVEQLSQQTMDPDDPHARGVATGTISNYLNNPAQKREPKTFQRFLKALQPTAEQLRQAQDLEAVIRSGTADAKQAIADLEAWRKAARAAGCDGWAMDEFTPLSAEVHTAVGSRRVGPDLEVDAADRDPTAYVPRDYDPLLRERIGRAAAGELRGVILLQGTSSTGKTRSLYEAVKVLGSGWRVLVPVDATALLRVQREREQLLDGPVVMWLNELQRFLRPSGQGLSIRLLEDLYTAAGAPLVIVATIWPDKRPERGDDRLHEARAVLDGHRGWVHTQEVRSFSPTELEAAQAAAENDPRMRRALKDSDRVGFTQILAGAGELLDFYRHADPIARLLLDAAGDARRLGHDQALPEALLREMTLASWRRRHGANNPPTDWWLTALTTAVMHLRGPHGIQPMFPVSDAKNPASDSTIGYELADYLQQHLYETRAFEAVPDSDWEAFATHTSNPRTLNSLAWAARARARFPQAERLYRKAFPCDPATRRELVTWLSEIPGRESSTEQALRDASALGDYEAHLELARWLARSGRQDDAEREFRKAAADTDDDCTPLRELGAWLGFWQRHAEAELVFHEAAAGGDHLEAFVDMGWWLAEQPGREAEAELAFRKAVEGDGCVGGWPALIRWLSLQEGREADYEQALREAASSGDARLELAERLARTGHQIEAEQIFRSEAAAGHSQALRQLSGWLESWSREPAAEQALRDAAAAGDVVAARTLPEWLAKRNRDADVENYLRAAIANGGSWALRQLAGWLANQPGREDDAGELLRSAVVDQLPGAPALLAIWLSNQAGRDVEADQAWRDAIDIDPLDAAVMLSQLGNRQAEVDRVFRKAVVAGQLRGLEKLTEWLGSQPSRAAEGQWIRRAGLDAFGKTLSM